MCINMNVTQETYLVNVTINKWLAKNKTKTFSPTFKSSEVVLIRYMRSNKESILNELHPRIAVLLFIKRKKGGMAI